MPSQTQIRKQELIDIITRADQAQIEALYKILVEPLKGWQGYELDDQHKTLLDEQKKLHKAGKTASFTLAQAKAHALKRLKK